MDEAARTKARKDVLLGSVMMLAAGLILGAVFSGLVGDAQGAGSVKSVPKALIAIPGLMFLIGLIKLPQGLVALAFKVRIDVEEYERLPARDQRYTALFAVGWMLTVFLGAMFLAGRR